VVVVVRLESITRMRTGGHLNRRNSLRDRGKTRRSWGLVGGSSSLHPLCGSCFLLMMMAVCCLAEACVSDGVLVLGGGGKDTTSWSFGQRLGLWMGEQRRSNKPTVLAEREATAGPFLSSSTVLSTARNRQQLQQEGPFLFFVNGYQQLEPEIRFVIFAFCERQFLQKEESQVFRNDIVTSGKTQRSHSFQEEEYYSLHIITHSDYSFDVDR
jgi:hypothetical protein